MKRAFIFTITMLFLLHGAALCAENEDFNFIVFGDSRVAFQGAQIPEAYKRILSEVNLINPDFVIHTGDLVYGYGDSDNQLKVEYSNIASLMSTVIPKIYFVPGNHDFQSPLTTKYFLQMTDQIVDHFTLVHKGARFIILNTDQPGFVGEVGGMQLTWLERELEASKDARAVFVIMHRPLFSWLTPNADSKGGKPEAMYNFVSEKARMALLALLVKYKVTAVFAGHEHLYYRTEYGGIPFITVGGGGATFSAPPDKGGFFNYMIVSLKGKDVSFGLMEPYHFTVETRTFESKGKTYGEANISNIHGEIEKGLIPLQGIKFTLPKGNYEVKAESYVSPAQMVRIAEAVGTMPKQGGIMDKVKQVGVSIMMSRYMKPKISKIVPNKDDPKMVDVWVNYEAPGTIPIRLVVSPVKKK